MAPKPPPHPIQGEAQAVADELQAALLLILANPTSAQSVESVLRGCAVRCFRLGWQRRSELLRSPPQPLKAPLTDEDKTPIDPFRSRR